MKNDILGPGGSTLTDIDMDRLAELAAMWTGGEYMKIGDAREYLELAPSIVPALIKEVLGLRRHNEILRRSNKHSRSQADKEAARHIAAACNAAPALVAEVRRLRDRVETLEWLVECEQAYRLCFLNVRYRHNMYPEKYDDVRECAMQAMVDILQAAREAIR